MDSVRYLEWLDSRDQAHISKLGEWWIRRWGIRELLGVDPLPDVLETIVVNCGLLAAPPCAFCSSALEYA